MLFWGVLQLHQSSRGRWCITFSQAVRALRGNFKNYPPSLAFRFTRSQSPLVKREIHHKIFEGKWKTYGLEFLK